jgi:hypothetical protein
MIQPSYVQKLEVRHLSLFVVLAALCLGIQLTPRPLNVESTSLIVFLTGAVLGVTFGAGLGSLVMFINGFLSPYGFAGLLLPFQMIGMALVGVGGGLYGRSSGGSYDSVSCVEAAVLGAFLTLIFDVLTNLGWAVPMMLEGQPILLAFVSVLVSGAFPSLVHVVSNTVFFGAAFVPVTSAVRKLLGGGHIWKKDFSLT